MKTINYKGFVGSAEVSIEDNCLHGKILFINDLVTYEADTVHELTKNFEEAVDDYINTCIDLGIEPQKSFSGTFNIRIGEELHREVSIFAVTNETTNNDVIKKAVENFLHKRREVKEVHNHTHNYTYNVTFKETSDNFIDTDEMQGNVTATFFNKEKSRCN